MNSAFGAFGSSVIFAASSQHGPGAVYPSVVGPYSASPIGSHGGPRFRMPVLHEVATRNVRHGGSPFAGMEATMTALASPATDAVIVPPMHRSGPFVRVRSAPTAGSAFGSASASHADSIGWPVWKIALAVAAGILIFKSTR